MPVRNTYRLFKKRVTKPFCWLFFLALTVWSPSSYWGPNSSFWQIVGSSVLVLHCLVLLLPFPLRPNQVPNTHCQFVSLLEINFYKKSDFIYQGSRTGSSPSDSVYCSKETAIYFLWYGVLPHSTGCSWYILRPTNLQKCKTLLFERSIPFKRVLLHSLKGLSSTEG